MFIIGAIPDKYIFMKKKKQKGYKFTQKDVLSKEEMAIMHKNRQTFWNKVTGGRMNGN